jgi:hypothetical protein
MPRIALFELEDSKVFPKQCYIDGTWLDAEGKSTIAANNPADGVLLGTAPKIAICRRQHGLPCPVIKLR